MATAMQYRRIIRARLAECGAAGEYWQYNGGEWACLLEQAETDGVHLTSVLQDAGLAILHRAESGAVHIG